MFSGKVTRVVYSQSIGKLKTKVGVTDGAKHSSLLRYGINNGRAKFYNADPCMLL